MSGWQRIRNADSDRIEVWPFVFVETDDGKCVVQLPDLGRFHVRRSLDQIEAMLRGGEAAKSMRLVPQVCPSCGDMVETVTHCGLCVPCTCALELGKKQEKAGQVHPHESVKAASRRHNQHTEPEQPTPVLNPDSVAVGERLKALIDQRTAIGIRKYGTPLMTHNGRDAHRDALEEALDLCQYLMQMVLETKQPSPPADRVEEAVHGSTPAEAVARLIDGDKQ